jgi:two-component system, cell cycle sensor histidine kinase and response regulator CckA
VVWEAESATGRCLFVSAHAEPLLGHPAASWLQPGFWLDHTHPDDYEWVQRLREDAAAAQKPYTCDFRMRRADLAIVWVRERGRLVMNGAGPRLRGFTTDIADLKRLEAELLHSRKLETLGRLIGGVAHDFTNLAMALTGYSDVVLLQLDDAHPARPYAEQLKTASQTAVNLLRQLLAFSRKKEIEPTLVNLNDSVKGMTKLLRKIIGDNIRVETQLDSELGLIRADAGQIDQVIMNLAVNARDAMPQGGRLSMETANVDGPGGNGRVVLRVRDTGVGMSPETQQRIFEPFFTTKAADKGTGLGLSLVHEIVERSGGTVRVESAPDQGTLFEIHLPRLQGDIALLSSTAPEEVPRGTETILFVDDDETVRRLLALGLERLGYRVLQAASGPAALALGEEETATIELIITDLVMADMSGLDVVRLLRSTRPQVKSVYVTGYADGHTTIAQLPDASALLEKPFRLDQLARLVRQVLDKPAA